MSPALNGSSAIRRFEGSDVIEIRDGITFDFYTGLPHVYVVVLVPVLVTQASRPSMSLVIASGEGRA